ncbi:MAG TPA: chromate transporter [Magnetospirillaceae bacterium]|nr:chromate transporter [Magnetospirillaceae bacterium]
MTMLELAWVFFRIGIAAYGGGWTIVGIIRTEVLGRGWITEAGFSDLVAVSQVTPGPIALNAATLVGYRLLGFPGAATATLAVVAFPVLAILTATSLLSRLGKTRTLLQESLKTGTMALVAMTLWTFLPSSGASWVSGLLAAAAFALSAFTKVHPLYIILGAGAAGSFLALVS